MKNHDIQPQLEIKKPNQTPVPKPPKYDKNPYKFEEAQNGFYYKRVSKLHQNNNTMADSTILPDETFA